MCVPSTTTCTGFKASSVQPASGDEKLSKLTFRERQRKIKKQSGQLSEALVWEDTKEHL